MCVGPGKESPDAGGQRGGGASEGTNQRAAREEPTAGEREPHPENTHTQYTYNITHNRQTHNTHNRTRVVLESDGVLGKNIFYYFKLPQNIKNNCAVGGSTHLACRLI